jgi:ketosteroid isomerase-like protein
LYRKGDCAVGSQPLETIERIREAITAHDLDALTACFAEDYVNETPIHPARGFRGRDQVRRNWQQIFAAAPDIRASVIRRANDGETAWSEWELRGTRSDGSALVMRGVGIFGVVDGRARWCRFYLDPVDDTPEDIDRATATIARGPKGTERP